jgi:hypothetical protein
MNPPQIDTFNPPACLYCRSFDLSALSQFDEESGEIALVLICIKCGRRERLPVNFL